MKMAKLLAVLVIAFALLLPTSASTIWVGTEDVPLQQSDRDYNDIVLYLAGTNLSIVGPGSWSPMVTPNQDGSPFWDNTSSDGNQLNVGYFLTGTGGFAGNPNSPNIAQSDLLYYSGPGGVSVPSFMMFAPGDIGASILIEVAGNAGSNEIRWFKASDPGTTYLLLVGPGSTSFNPGENFGLVQTGSGGTFRTDLNGENFAAFSQVPEPTTFAMLGLGLGFVGLAQWRRRRQHSEVS